MSFQQYNDFMQQNKLSTNTAETKMVQSVGERIQKAVEDYFAQRNMSSQLENYSWEFNLVESPEVNAWCMPGGKVVVYTGILPIAKDEAGLSVVMGHEIAHAIAEHGNERMSQSMIAQMSGMALSAAIKEKPAETKQLWMTAFGLGSQYGVLLPFSRLQEGEADHLGLIFMAMAGFDPNRAISFWEEMSQHSGKSPPEFLSTHPSDATRIGKIRALIPEAMTDYSKQ